MTMKRVALLHDNAHPHTAIHTVHTHQQINFNGCSILHTVTSQLLKIITFGSLKNILRAYHFTTDQ
jgi:hypothetical protein